MPDPKFDPDEPFTLDVEPDEALRRIVEGDGAEEVSEEPEDPQDGDQAVDSIRRAVPDREAGGPSDHLATKQSHLVPEHDDLDRQLVPVSPAQSAPAAESRGRRGREATGPLPFPCPNPRSTSLSACRSSDPCCPQPIAPSGTVAVIPGHALSVHNE
jgi:hypothetical protein